MINLNDTSVEPIESPFNGYETRMRINSRLSHKRVWFIIWPELWDRVGDKIRDQIIWTIKDNSNAKLE